MPKKNMPSRPVQKVEEEQKDDNAYFVSIRSPLEYRRQLLESSKKAIYCLQNHQRVLLIRQRKLKEAANLKHSLRELMFLNRKFNEKLPKYETALLHEAKKISRETESAFKEYKAVERRPAKDQKKKEKTDLDRLEDALSSIEGKLKSLK